MPKEPGISWAARDPLWGGGEERRRGPCWQLWPRLFPSVADTMCPPHSHLSSRLHAQGLRIKASASSPTDGPTSALGPTDLQRGHPPSQLRAWGFPL